MPAPLDPPPGPAVLDAPADAGSLTPPPPPAPVPDLTATTTTAPEADWSTSAAGPSGLTPAARWALAAAWVAILGTFGIVANTGYRLGTHPFWVGPWLPVVAALPVLAIIALIADHRFAVPLSVAGAVVLCVSALVDLSKAPAMAAAQGVLAVAALLFSLAGVLVRHTRA